ncbi:unnamed protein product [Ostreobium quekettii]|uniref:Tryptophan synthase n=1 Tax=Ostreobium quekettii TaxID=121088 RepID=A0A8S1IRD6_9CHLO|nr:unnamed protein product [Ostreobium quekettii]|eukprot:evm.model.scf_118.7 EVM.evm.TU.scf_118.7   scf_118:113548-117249(-)
MEEIKASGRKAFIPYLCAGDPDLATTSLALKQIDEAGADVIELGVPYSDPLADGPAIQSAATRALQSGTTLDAVFDMLRALAPELQAPVIMFTYYNPILARGLDTFCRQLKDAGASGLLVPDLPLEETSEVREACAAAGLELVLLTTPTTPKDRMTEIARATQGFVYLVSVTGVTGVRDSVATGVEGLIDMLHNVTDKPVAVGFGISKQEHVQQVASWGAEGFIVGSALVRALGEASSPAEGLAALKNLATELRAAAP